MHKISQKEKALKFRSEGQSFEEIQRSLGVPMSTLASWLRSTSLTSEQYEAIGMKTGDGRGRSRALAALTHKKKRIEREKETIREADRTFDLFLPEPLFVSGIVMYWGLGAGGGRAFHFTSSDPASVFLVSSWASKYLLVPKEEQSFRLYTYDSAKKLDFELFWANFLGISASKIKKTTYVSTRKPSRMAPGYRGSIRLEINKIRHIQTVERWQKRLIGLILSK